ncbi:MAG: hypothetical protein Q9218_002193 [Villophora microphyllina]
MTVELFVILHLLGDPIDTMKNLLLKMSTCQTTASFWKEECKLLLETPVASDGHHLHIKDRDWKALAMVTDAYGEWNKGSLAQAILHEALSVDSTLYGIPDVKGYSIGFTNNVQAKRNLMTAVRQTGRALAADRSTKSLPIIVAQTFFIGAVAIAIGRTTSAARLSTSSDTVFINVEAHSIAFSALCFWIIPAVFLASVIGVSQTEAAIPRILRRFQGDLDRSRLLQRVQMPNHCLEDDQKRVFYGGIYSWQPSRCQPGGGLSTNLFRIIRQASWQSHRYSVVGNGGPTASHARYPSAPHGTTDQRPLSYHHEKFPRLLPYPILLLGVVTGIIVSSRVPPDGFDCRNVGQVLICVAWLLSAGADYVLVYLFPLESRRRNFLFWLTGLKDLIMTVATMGGVAGTQVGVFNRCDCYTLWGKTGLALPERPDLAALLFKRLQLDYPAITFTCIGLELIAVPLFICIWYQDAFRVFVQRDDRHSNAARFWKAGRKLQMARRHMRQTLTQSSWRRPRPLLSRTLAVEAQTGEQTEMQPLAPTFSNEPDDYQVGGGGTAGELGEPSIPIATNTESESSSVNPPPPSGNPATSTLEARRRNTAPQKSGLDDFTPTDRSQNDRILPKKPAPSASGLRGAGASNI